MNSIIFLFASLLSAVTFQSATTTIELQNAMEQRQILATFTGASGSTHYLKPLSASIRNLKNQQISIVIPAGYHFRSEDSTVQDIITTQEELLVLKPREVLEVKLSGMCIQHHNGAPGADDGFKLAGFANPKLKKLALYLDEKNVQDYKGQQAMWIVSDGEDLRYIIGIGSTSERELIDLVASITNQPTITEKEYAAYKQEVISPVYKSELRGKFAFNFNMKVPIHIALFDENGIVLQEIYNQVAPAGRQEVTYTFDAVPYEGKTIHAKLIAFDDVLLDRKISL
jgi:hypothetical protein